MMIDYNVVAYAGARVLEMVTDEAQRAEYDRFLHNIAVFIGTAMRDEIEKLVDEINSAVGEHYVVRLVHEDTQDFVEVKPITRGEE
jgi:hypothetical protein